MEKLAKIFICSTLLLAQSAYAGAQDNTTEFNNPLTQFVSDRISFTTIRDHYNSGNITNPIEDHITKILLSVVYENHAQTETYLEAAEAYAKTVNSPEFYVALARLRYAHYDNTQNTAGLLNWVQQETSTLRHTRPDKAEYEQLVSQLIKENGFKLNLKNDVKHEVDSFILTNASNVPERIIIDVDVEGHASSLLIDTGAYQTAFDRSLANNIDDQFTLGAEGLSGRIAGKNFIGSAGTLSSLRVGSVKFSDFLIGKFPFDMNERFSIFPDGNGVLGITEILNLGDQIKFNIGKDRIENLQISRNKATSNEAPLDRNIFIINLKAYVDVEIDNRVYACLWDTGAPFTFVSQAIIDRHGKTAFGKKLSKKAKRKKGLPTNIGKFVKAAPIKIANQTIDIETIYVNPNKEKNTCYVGLDTIVKAGGATFHVKDRHIAFGPITD